MMMTGQALNNDVFREALTSRLHQHFRLVSRETPHQKQVTNELVQAGPRVVDVSITHR